MLESPNPENLLEACRKEGIKDQDISLLLENFLQKFIGAKNSKLYWEKVKHDASRGMELMSPKQIKDQFLENYLQKFQKEFIIDEFTKPIIEMLCLYFAGHSRAEELGLDLKKGILLHGDVGTGKSSILSCFTKNQRQSFKMIDCLWVAAEYSKLGYEGLLPYTQDGIENRFPREFWGQERYTWCFDDLGVELEKKHFGNEANVMAEVIQMLYDRQGMRGNIHFTTNLSAEQIRTIYGSRVASRLREMVNIIIFPDEAPDRRI